MNITPSQILTLAIERHHKPWNWTLHFASLAGFALTLFSHSYLMFATTLITFGAGFFELHLPPMGDGRWHRFVTRMTEWEKNWMAMPWNRRKTGRFVLALLPLAITIWALWARDPVVLLLIVGFACLLVVRQANIEGGIDP